MTRDRLFSYVKKEYGVEPDFPFDRDFESAVLRHKDTRKWFALVMYVKADRLGHDSEDSDNLIDVVTMKCDPMMIDMLIQQEGYHRAYHMNKTQWLTVELESSVSDEEIKNLINRSYRPTDKAGSKGRGGN